jgi:hypothetical protein
MSEHDDRLDQRLVSQLWEMENADQADQRVELEGGEYLSLFVDADNGRSYIFRHGSRVDANEDVDVGSETEDEVYEFEDSRNAQAAFDEMVDEAAAEGRLVDDESEGDELGDADTEGPVTTETGVENQRDW